VGRWGEKGEEGSPNEGQAKNRKSTWEKEKRDERGPERGSRGETDL